MPLVVGNWKMNPKSLGEAKELFVKIRKEIDVVDNVRIVIAPPSVFISDLGRLSPSGRMAIAAQAIYPIPSGPYTGEISIPMVISTGVDFVLIGHSERRSRGIDDDGVCSRLKSAWKEKVTPIVCVGESTRDGAGDYFSVVESQIQHAFRNATKSQVKKTVIAYEPVWAIGTGCNATADDVHEMRLYIEKCLTKLYDRSTAGLVCILYGGSVNVGNVENLYKDGNVDGFLVGGASLNADNFSNIIKRVSNLI